MKGLTEREIQWLEAFAKNHEFFASFLLHYKLKKHLANNQYYWLRLYINQTDENGDTLLTTEELAFLEENSHIMKSFVNNCKVKFQFCME